MFRDMRRFKQKLTEQECIEILENNTAGVLALLGDEGYPYAVPLSYVYINDKIYFHSAKSGHKLDAIEQWHKASFCVIDKDQIVPEKYTTLYGSAIAFGKVRVLTQADEIEEALVLIAQKYSPLQDNKQSEIARGMPSVSIIELEIEHLSGKQAKELLEAKGEV